MTERERMIELLNDWGNKENDGMRAESIADYLLQNGVVVLPCNVGDTVYYPDYITGIAEKCQVYGFQLFANRKLQLLVDDGKLKFVTPNWYYTKEEAKKALERSKNNE